MTVKRGEAWGQPYAGQVVIDLASDAEIARVVAGEAPPIIRAVGGDLARTLGATAHRGSLLASPALSSVCPVDLGWAETSGGRRPFVAHCVGRRSWWHGEILAVMNAQFIGHWDLAPRSHPNDGRFDVTMVADMPIGQRWQAWRRLPTGAHLPHPNLATSSVKAGSWTFARPLDIWLDGERWCRSDHLDIEVVPDAFHAAI